MDRLIYFERKQIGQISKEKEVEKERERKKRVEERAEVKQKESEKGVEEREREKEGENDRERERGIALVKGNVFLWESSQLTHTSPFSSSFASSSTNTN